MKVIAKFEKGVNEDDVIIAMREANIHWSDIFLKQFQKKYHCMPVFIPGGGSWQNVRRVHKK